MKEKIPNFLIVGAARSGTTSLYCYLKEHPEIYMSPLKEPKFFTAQSLKLPQNGPGDEADAERTVREFKDYKKLFSKVHHEKAIGEASIDNLYYHAEAIPHIKKYLGDPKIIMFLRNPAERTYSQYLFFRGVGKESLDFEDALRAEEKRKADNWSFFWHYAGVSFYHEAVKDYFENFSRVKIYLFEDLENDPLALIQDIFRFLSVDSTFIPDLEVRFNSSGLPKNRILYRILFSQNPVKKAAVRLVTRVFSLKKEKAKFKENIHFKITEKPDMNPETRARLIALFHDDILKLQELIGRDLSAWLA